MKARFLQRTHSAEAGEEAANSSYSTARSIENALLFDGIRTVVLPLVSAEDRAQLPHDESPIASSLGVSHFIATKRSEGGSSS
jgi:hypothetical protein